MGSSIKRLFDDELPLSAVLLAHRERALAEIPELASTDSADQEQQVLLELLSYTPVTLQRQEAVIRSSAVGSGTGVTLRVPFEGDPEVFWHRPASEPPALEGRVHDGSGFYSDDPNEQPSVEFERLFSAEASVREIREWAERVTDELEKVLGQSQKVIDVFNRDLAAEITDTLAKRGRVLNRAASLEESFGTGI